MIIYNLLQMPVRIDATEKSRTETALKIELVDNTRSIQYKHKIKNAQCCNKHYNSLLIVL